MFNPLNFRKHYIYSSLYSLSVVRLFILNLKTIYSTWSSRIVVIFSPFFVALTLSLFLPLAYSIGAGQIFVTTLSAGTIWGMTFFSIKKSTIYNNISTTRIKDFELYLSIFLSILLVTFFSQVTYWLSSIFFNYIISEPIAAHLIGGIYNIKGMDWSKIDWVTILYSWILSILLIYMMSFFMRNIFNSDKIYFISLFIYLLLLIPFGGLLRPNIYNGDTANVVGVQYGKLNIIQYISLIFPQYHINSLNFAAVSSGAIVDYGAPTGYGTFGNFEFLSSFRWSSDWRWNFTLLYPIFFLLTLILISSISVKIQIKSKV